MSGSAISVSPPATTATECVSEAAGAWLGSQATVAAIFRLEGRLLLMPIETRPATVFDDLKTILGPKRPDANVCWCLSYRLPSKENRALVGPARGDRVKQLLEDGPIGVLAYDGDEVVGWAAVAPRADTNFARSRKIPHVDHDAVWAVWCIRVRPGHRKKGISHHLLRGAVDFAREGGAPAIEGYPVDNQGEKVDLTMAYVGTRRLFEQAGFSKVADTESVLDGFPRVLMRLDLR
jgi:GNAT superfamily N-acetyltransferase